jgi:hypothetical protein
MPAQPAGLTIWARSGLVLLCLLLAASVAVRIYAHRQQSEGGAAGWEALGAPVDLGEGILLPRTATQALTMRVQACTAPVSINFFQAGPYEQDPSLLGRPRPDDRVFYVYRGWKLEGWLATVSLNAIYYARHAYARLTMSKRPAWDDMAGKIIVPAGCDASLGDVMAVLRQDVRRGQ